MARIGNTTKQFGLLGLANFASLGTNILLNIALTHTLSQTSFGSYRYAIAYLHIVAVIAQFGVPYSMSVVLARHPRAESNRLITTATLAMSVIAAIASLIGLLGAWIVSQFALFDPILWLAAVLPLAVVLQTAYLNLLNGANAIGSLAIQTAGPPLLTLIGIVAAHAALGRELTAVESLLLFACAYIVTHSVTLTRFAARPHGYHSEHVREAREVLHHAGRFVYVGSVAATGMSHFLLLVVGTILPRVEYAVYALAYSMASPVQMLPAVLGAVLFRRNATSTRLSRRVIIAALLLTIAALIAYVVALVLLFPLVFPEEYAASARLASILAIAFALYGVGDFFNRFIGAHGRGKRLMLGAVLSGLTNLVVTSVLISTFGTMAAVAGVVSAGALYAALMGWGYRQTVKELSSRD